MACLHHAMAASSIQIIFQTLGGRPLEVSVPKESLVLDLKRCVCDAWHIEPGHQKLAVGSEVLLDFDIVESPCEGGALYITVITTQELLPSDRVSNVSALVGKMVSDDSRVRRNAISNLVHVVDATNQRELVYFVSEVESQVFRGRSAAAKRAGLDAIVKVSPKGHSASISAAAQNLEDPDELVRLTAVEAVAALTHRGHEPTIYVAKRLSRSRFASIKVVGILVLGDVVEEHSPVGREVMHLFEKFSEHSDQAVREAASHAVSSILRDT